MARGGYDALSRAARARSTGLNSLPIDDPARSWLVTLESSPNTYLAYPALGKIVVHEFDIHGNPSLVGFKPYRTNGTYGAVVELGLSRDCEWRDGFRDGATVVLWTSKN